jgi:hypothetical protein
MKSKDQTLLEEAYKRIYESAGEVTSGDGGEYEDSPDMSAKRDEHLEKAENYIHVLRSRGWKQASAPAEGKSGLYKYTKGKNVVSIEKTLDGRVSVVINGEPFTGKINKLKA